MEKNRQATHRRIPGTVLDGLFGGSSGGPSPIEGFAGSLQILSHAAKFDGAALRLPRICVLAGRVNQLQLDVGRILIDDLQFISIENILDFVAEIFYHWNLSFSLLQCHHYGQLICDPLNYQEYNLPKNVLKRIAFLAGMSIIAALDRFIHWVPSALAIGAASNQTFLHAVLPIAVVGLLK